METTFKKVFIKSEADLPKESKDYFVGYKNGGIATVHWHNNKQSWLAYNDYYLLPLEPAEVSEEVYSIKKERIYEVINTLKLKINSRLNFTPKSICDNLDTFRDEILSLPKIQKAENVKKYICTDCQTRNYLEDNGEVRVGECRNCGHPLWNPADSSLPQVSQVTDEDIEEAIRLLYRAHPCVLVGLKDEQLSEDMRCFLMGTKDRDISSWYCPECKIFIDSVDVTFEETHDPRAGGCGHYVKSKKAHRDGKIPTSDKGEKGAPFDDPENFNPACDKCGHQNSENCNSCAVLTNE